jgi:uncharacterized LabA/DUF88 family protein
MARCALAEISESLVRTTYYDARPDGEGATPSYLSEYWAAVEALPDTDLGWGILRGGERKSSPRRQKGVDVLIAVDMLTNSFARNCDLLVLEQARFQD